MLKKRGGEMINCFAKFIMESTLTDIESVTRELTLVQINWNHFLYVIVKNAYNRGLLMILLVYDQSPSVFLVRKIVKFLKQTRTSY